MDFRGPLLRFLVFLALAGMGFCSAAGGQVEEGACETFCVAQASISIMVFLLVIAAAVIYAGGQILGAHMRSRAAVWATSMIVGALIGVLIYLVIPPVMGAMLLPEGSGDIGSVCACSGGGSAPPSGPDAPPTGGDDDDEGGEEDDGDDADDETSPGGGGGGGGEEDDDDDGGDEGDDTGGGDQNDTDYGDDPDEDDTPSKEEDEPEETECFSHSDCAAGGTCSFQCMNADEVGAVSEACPGVSESVCYSYTSCGCYDGACGWEQTPEFLECLDDPPPNPVQPGCIIDSDCNVGGICGGLCYSPSDYVCEPGEICEAPPKYVPCVGSGTEVCYGTYGTCGCSAGACGWEPSAELDECLADPPVCVATPAGCNCFIDADCARAGCSSELCVSAEDAAGIVSTCDYKDWYNCLPLSSCGCNAGKCAWDQNEEYLECLADPPSNAIECMADSDCEITGCLSDSGTCVPSSMVEEIEANCEHWGGLILPGEVCGCNGGTCGWTSMPEGHTAD